MSRWRSISTQKAKGARRDSDAELRLINAYHDVFSREDEATELVMADLADFCGFYKVPPPGSPSEGLQYEAGLRAAFGRLFHFLTLSDERLAALEKAARFENETNATEGYL